MLALLSHLAVTIGVPSPLPSRVKPISETVYPCQSRLCGCLTSEQCWAGDCCCFTLEEKLAWAEHHGVEPPDHVRPLIESRKGRAAPAVKQKSCCLDAHDTPDPSTCCSRKMADEAEPPGAQPGVRWVLGVYAKTCRGLGPDGPFALDPVVVPDHTPAVVKLFPPAFNHPVSDHLTTTTSSPPVPPPRG